MTKSTLAKSFRNYIECNKVVFQPCEELMEVSNDTENKNRETVTSFLAKTTGVTVYDKHNCFVSGNWFEQTEWPTDEDQVFLLESIDILIYVPKKEAIANNPIEA